MAILKIEWYVLFLFLGFSTTLFLVPPLVIASFKKESQQGLDVIYATLVIYVLTFITIAIMSRILFEQLISFF
ncbi:hypothetical protein [Neobacillus drentensis]|uniref:hypothetical protein n=1 Tax=Neobacillus drentensis TaxID=220684 RepID=UPI003003266F